MTTFSFIEFLKTVVLEELHPELQDAIQGASRNKHKLVVDKIKDLQKRGETTGIEGNMPKGSSRAWLSHEEHHPMTVDGKHTNMKVGTKFVIKADLDKHHESDDNESLGQMQNRKENGDHFVNNEYRTLTKDHETGHYHTNEHGIFPPLVDHDDENHEHSTIGHSRDITSKDFKDLTKSKDHPKGITHKDFGDALERHHDQSNGRYWKGNEQHEAKLDHITEHPLVQKFLDHQQNTGAMPHDYRQKKNLGVWKHPVTGKEHIVARDHGFDHEVSSAYTKARKKHNEASMDRDRHARDHRGY